MLSATLFRQYAVTTAMNTVVSNVDFGFHLFQHSHGDNLHVFLEQQAHMRFWKELDPDESSMQTISSAAVGGAVAMTMDEMDESILCYIHMLRFGRPCGGSVGAHPCLHSVDRAAGPWSARDRQVPFGRPYGGSVGNRRLSHLRDLSGQQ